MTPRRNDPSKGGYAVRVPVTKTAKPAAKPAAKRAAPKTTTREPSQADLDSHMRIQGREQQDAEGFVNSTRMRYMQGGDEYAKGGKVKGSKVKGSKVKGAAKVAQMNAAFKKGDNAPMPKAPAPKKRGVPVASREPMIKRAMGGMTTKC